MAIFVSERRFYSSVNFAKVRIMKLLIVTQKVDENDDVLGFMHGWIKEFAKHCEKIIVVALGVGQYDLPKNVKVLSLGKPAQGWSASGGEKITGKLKALFNFYKYIWRERKNYDAVFVHMNAEYVVLAGWLWRLLGKKVGLWYAHGRAPWSLKFAEKFVHIIFTSTATGCRINSKKIKVIGQGIDVEKFKPLESRDLHLNYFKVLSVGRISPIKDYETLIEAIDILVKKKSKEKIQVDIIGAPAFPSQEEYLERLQKIVIEKGLENVVRFLGPMPNKDIVGFLQAADIFVNTSHTGSLDKAIVEAMACGLPILTCNEALESVLGDLAKLLIYPKKDSVKLAEKIGWLAGLGEKERRNLGEKLRFIAVRDHSLENFAKKIKQALLSI